MLSSATIFMTMTSIIPKEVENTFNKVWKSDFFCLLLCHDYGDTPNKADNHHQPGHPYQYGHVGFEQCSRIIIHLN